VWLRSIAGCFGEEKHFLPQPAIELRFPGRPARRPVTALTAPCDCDISLENGFNMFLYNMVLKTKNTATKRAFQINFKNEILHENNLTAHDIEGRSRRKAKCARYSKNFLWRNMYS
jgi:hypothetical protein